MIRTSDLIQLTRDYQNALPLVAFPLNMPINLNATEQAREFIAGLTKSANGEQVGITNYAQLQEYMQAQNLLKIVATLPKAASKKSIEEWQRDRYKLPSDFPEYIVFFDEILKTQKEWHEKARYLNIPDNFKYEAGIAKYYEAIKKLPPEKHKEKELEMRALNILKDPQTLFNNAKTRATSDLEALVQLVRDKHQDKNTYIGHVFIDLGIDLKGHGNMSKAFSDISNWLRYGINELYRIDDKVLDKVTKNISNSVKQSNAIKDQKDKAKREKEEAESTQRLEQFKATAKELQENNPEGEERKRLETILNNQLRSALTYFEDAQKKEEIAMQYYNALQSMPGAPKSYQYGQLARYLELARSSNEQSIREAAESLLNFTKP